MKITLRWLKVVLIIILVAKPTNAASTPKILSLADNDREPAKTDGSDAITELKQLIGEQRWLAAKLLAEELRPSLEGNPRFDFHYGILLFELGHPDAAILALERGLWAEPSNSHATYRLAQAYAATGQYYRAADRLADLLTAEEEDVNLAPARALLAQNSAYESDWLPKSRFGITLWAGWDEAANRQAPSMDVAYALASAVDAVSIASSYSGWSISSGIDTPLNQRLKRSFGFDFTALNNRSTEVDDTQSGRLMAALDHKTASRERQLIAQPEWSVKDNRLSEAAVSLSYNQLHRTGTARWLGAALTSRVAIPANSEHSAGNQIIAGLLFEHRGATINARCAARYSHTEQQSQEGTALSWFGLTNGCAITKQASNGWRTGTDLIHHWRSYKAAVVTVDEVATAGNRKQQDYQLSVVLWLRWQGHPWLETQSNLGWHRYGSNSFARPSDRLVISQSIGLTF